MTRKGVAPDDTPIAFKELEGGCRTHYGYPNQGDHPRALPAVLLLLLLSTLI